MKRNIAMLAFLLVLAAAVTLAQTPSNSQSNTQNVPGQTAQSETQKNSAGSISGNASPTNTAPGTPSEIKPGTTPDPTAPTVDKNAAPPAAQSSTANSGMTAAVATDSATLKGQLESAFQAEPTLTGSNIQVSVSDTTVVLNGSVPSGKEKITAKRIAQSYAGNRKVVDKLTVSGRGNAAPNAGPTEK